MDPSLRRGVDLFNEHEFFECHEVLEQLWAAENGPRKRFLQSIIHLAVAYYHDGRGNRAGAQRQLRKAIDKLAPFPEAYDGLDTGALLRAARRSLASAQRGEPLQYPVISLCDSR